MGVSIVYQYVALVPPGEPTMAHSGWLAGLVVGLAIGLSGLSGVAVGAWWATPPPLPSPQPVKHPKHLPTPPGIVTTRAHSLID